LLCQLRKIKGGGERVVYIIDSKSTENSREIIEPQLAENEYFIQAEENYGYGKCCNIGIRKGFDWGAEFFLILNPDVRLEPNFLLKLLIALQAQKKCGIACPLTLSEDGERVQSLGGSISLWTGRAKRRFYNEKIENLREDFEYVDFPEGNAILVKREFFEDAGLFHEKFFLYYEDVEIGLRAKKEYWKVVAIPKSKVYHKDTTKE
ncbi:MAG: glycosyltransferase family 2 protein, partial [Acidobacteria bacterium]|nr:glycosyltransferase family 2 protein [Acidobacteriota bacterium]